MRLFILFFLFATGVFAGTVSAPLLSVDGELATIKTDTVQEGLTGFIVRHFTQEHNTILANAVVTGYDKEQGIAELQLSEYTGLHQNALPNGTWSPAAGDEALLGFGYSRALLLAPTDEIYHAVTDRIPSIEWVHPDLFAAFLSYRGHPSPVKEDINDFCDTSSAGLLYIYLQESLFTLDCHSLSLLQITPLRMERGEEKLPFYFRFEQISEAWFGEGSDPIEAYDPYYFHMIAEHNPRNGLLHHYVKKNEVPVKASDSWFNWSFDNIDVTFGRDAEEE